MRATPDPVCAFSLAPYGYCGKDARHTSSPDPETREHGDLVQPA